MFDTHHHVHNHYEHDPQMEARLRSVENSSGLILRKLETIMVDTTALVAAAQRAKKDNADLLAVLTSVRDQNRTTAAALKAVQEQLAALPADTAAQEAAIAAVVTDLNKIADDSEAAVANNPAVPDMPAAPTV